MLSRKSLLGLGAVIISASLLLVALAYGSDGTFDRAWGKDVGGAGVSLCTVAANCQVGTPGSLGGEFIKPGFVAADGAGNVYVADGGSQGNGRVQKFDSSGSFLLSWGKDVGGGGIDICTQAAHCQAGNTGAQGGEFGTNGPDGVATDPSGNVYVSEFFVNRIQKFDSSGHFLEAFGKDVGGTGVGTCTVAANCQAGTNGGLGGEFWGPEGIASDASGNIYVVDVANERIQEFDSSFKFLRAWGQNVGGTGQEVCTDATKCTSGTLGSQGGQFDSPVDVAADTSGGVYVTDARRVQKFDSSGNFLRAWGKDVGGTGVEVCTVAANCQFGNQGEQGGQFSGPAGVALDAANDVYVADESAGGRVEKFDSSGNFLRTWGKDVGGSGVEVCTAAANCQMGAAGGKGGQFAGLAGVAADTAGNLYVGDTSNQRVQKFAVGASSADPTSVSVACSPASLTVGETSTCALTVTDTSAAVTPTGSVTVTISGTAGGSLDHSSCALTGSGNSSACSVNYTAAQAGSETVAASYPANATFASSQGSASVAVAASGGAISATEGQPFSGRLLTSGCALASGSIDWGDGTTPTAARDAGNPHGVAGDHTYFEEGNFTGTVNYDTSCGHALQAQFQASVADAPLSASGSDVSGTQGQALNENVAHFTDADPNGAASDYAATIHWGDGSTSSGTVVATAGGGFDVSGTHTYSAAGNFTLTTAITDAGSSAASTSSTAQIATAPLVVVAHTLGVDQITVSSARAFGTVNDAGHPVTYHFEYGPSISYGSTTPVSTTDGSGTDEAVEATLSGLQPDTDYHARVVATASGGPVFGEDVAFHTARASSAQTGLPPGLDFTWTPKADVLVAGAPAGGIQFQATPGAGVSYQWAFDSPPGSGFVPDPAATDNAPRHAFTADGAHDTDKADGATGGRRRLYTVRLRATAANGASVEVSHDLVVVPNAPPLVDFQVGGAQNVDQPTVLTPAVSDPAGPRVANHIDHIEWSFDSPTAAHPAGDPSAVDLICNADGSACHVPGGGTPAPWFSQGNGHQAVVNFYQRALAAHGLPELSTLDLNALPQRTPDGQPLTGGLRYLDGVGPRTVYHDLRVAYLYDNATLLQQSSFAQEAGEATGARLKSGAELSADTTRSGRAPRAFTLLPYTTTVKGPDPRLLQLSALKGHQLDWRQVTLTAVDTAGLRTTLTESVPLRPVAAPELRASFVDDSVPPNRRRRRIGQAPSNLQVLNHPLTTDDVLSFNAGGTQDPTGKIAYYTLEVGQRQDCRAPASHPQQGTPGIPSLPGAESVNPPVDGYQPGEFFGRPTAGGAGNGTIFGRTGSLAAAGANPRNILNIGLGGAGARARVAADQTGLPTLGEKLALGPVVHPCLSGDSINGSFAARNVQPQVFMVRQGPAARLPFRQPPNIRPIVGAKQPPLQFATTALVTTNPDELRFRIPTPGVYSVTVAAYNEAGLGAIQRTDGFRIDKPGGGCEPATGQLTLAGKKLGFSGECANVGGKDRSRVWTPGDLTVNGVTLRPLHGAHVFVDTRGGVLFATTAALPGDINDINDAQIADMNRHPGDVEIVFERDSVARFLGFDEAAAARFIQGSRDPSSNPAVFSTATYHGSSVAAAKNGGANWDTLHIDFAGASGDSRAYFRVVLPTEFTSEAAAASPTSDVVRVGHTDVPETELCTHHFAGIAKHHGARRRAKTADASCPLAQTASAGVSGTLDLKDTHVGPLTVNQGTLTFDSSQGLWHGEIHDAYLEMFPQYKVSVNILIQNGELRQLGGSVDGLDIPVFAGVFLNEVHFQIVTDPLTLSGGARLTALAGALTGELDMVIRTKPVFLRLEGRIAVASIPLAEAYVQYDEANHSTVSFGGHLGIDFGPVSMNADLNGAISGQTGDFFIEGDGEVCLGLCFDAGALMSNVAVALCGGFHVGPLKVEAGAAYRFSPGKLEVFAGCDLDPYKPAIFRAREVRSGGTVARVSVAASPLSVPAGTHEVAFRFTGGPGTTGAPSVTLISPAGRRYETAPTAGDYSFTAPIAGSGGVTQIGGALLDRDPVDHVTTAIIVNPPAGSWQVQTPPAQPPIASVQIAYGEHVPDNAFHASVAHASLSGSGTRIQTQAFTAALPPAQARLLRTMPKIERGRLVSARLNLPSGLTGKLQLMDVGPTTSKPIQTIDLAKTHGQLTIAFAPTDEPGPHQIQAIKYQPASGPGGGNQALPQRAFVVGAYIAPPLPAPSVPRLHIHRDRQGRVLVDVTPGSAGTLSGNAATFEVVASTAAGERIEQVVYGFHGVDSRRARRNLNQVKPLPGGRFRVTLTGIPKSTTVKVYGRMDYATAVGHVASAMLRCHACRRGQ